MKMGIVLGALCLLLPAAGAAWAATHLAGDISATTFNSASGPFVVEQEIVVPANKRVAVGAGQKSTTAGEIDRYFRSGRGDRS